MTAVNAAQPEPRTFTSMLTTIVVVLELVRGASLLGCYGFEAYSECGEPQKEFRIWDMQAAGV